MIVAHGMMTSVSTFFSSDNDEFDQWNKSIRQHFVDSRSSIGKSVSHPAQYHSTVALDSQLFLALLRVHTQFSRLRYSHPAILAISVNIRLSSLSIPVQRSSLVGSLLQVDVPVLFQSSIRKSTCDLPFASILV